MTVSQQPDEADPGTSTATLYDAFLATANQLIARYSHLAESATTEHDHDAWWRRSMQVRDDRQAVPAHDRAQLTAHTTLWTTELTKLRANSPS
ncbi:hypothetical protein ABIA33_005108 [Streptacidiphilus sp. MAP12-16]|uniref:hypothetical protein n=1 Tax=Streptacidiphilus sp. MAP12-16 TaxID=3156300 RepID=UPI003516322F